MDSNSAHEWRHKVYTYGPVEAEALHAAVDKCHYKLSELRAAVSERAAQGAVVLRLSCNLFEASTGAHEWGAGFRLAELLLSRPHLVQGATPPQPLNIEPAASLQQYTHPWRLCELRQEEEAVVQASLCWSWVVGLGCWG